MKYYLFFFCILLSFSLYSQDFIGNIFFAMNQQIQFESHELTYTFWESDNEITETRSYEYRIINNTPFIDFNDEKYNDWLILNIGGAVFLYDDSSKPFFIGFTKRQFEMLLVNIADDNFCASSYLEEGKNLYLAENLRFLEIDKPWSEGVDGFGIGESIVLENTSKFSSFFLSNGFVSYRKPYLYSLNGRIKKIKTTDEEGNVQFFDVLDSPNIQEFQLEGSTRRLTLEIIEVYQGEKYEDTCLTFLFSN